MEEYIKRRRDVDFEEPEIIMKDASYSWGFKKKSETTENKNDAKMIIEESNESILRGINIHLKSGDLLMVIGAVGTGKTTLINSILGETVLIEGEATFIGKIAYVE